MNYAVLSLIYQKTTEFENGILYNEWCAYAFCFPLVANCQLSSVSPVTVGLMGSPTGKSLDPLAHFQSASTFIYSLLLQKV